MLASFVSTYFFIPCSIFTEKLSGLETFVKYLKENKNISFKEIADLLKRSQKTIWQTYNQSKKKYPDILQEKFSLYQIPISILQQRHIAVLEHIVAYLKEQYHLSFSKIAEITKRDPKTIWTVYNRARKKYAQ